MPYAHAAYAIIAVLIRAMLMLRRALRLFFSAAQMRQQGSAAFAATRRCYAAFFDVLCERAAVYALRQRRHADAASVAAFAFICVAADILMLLTLRCRLLAAAITITLSLPCC